MLNRTGRTAFAILVSTLLISASIVAAQDSQANLKITGRQAADKPYNRVTPTPEVDGGAIFRRVRPQGASAAVRKTPKRQSRIRLHTTKEAALARPRTPAAAIGPMSFGTGGGDILEVEPNDRVAQGVSLPVNVFGEIGFDGDVDFFAFQGLAGERVNVEVFAARLRNSELVADVALFDAAGRLLDRAVGDEEDDPFLTFTPVNNQVLVVGVADLDDFGGPASDYILNITRGVDVEEDEPNDRAAQNLPAPAVTVFGEIDKASDVDFYSFVAAAGQTLIVDVDAEVYSSRLDPEINLLDPQTGAEFVYNDQFDGDDPRFNIVLPYTGRYVIGIGAFDSNSSGFYRLNASLVSGAGAPALTRTAILTKKKLEITGAGFVPGAVVEVAGRERRTTFINSGTLHAKVKARPGDVVTVINPPDGRRSNPLLVQ